MPQTADASARRSGTHATISSGTAPGGVQAVVPEIVHAVYGETIDRVLLAILGSFTLVLCVWIAVSGSTVSLALGPSIALAVLASVTIVLAIRATREATLDRGSRRCWRGIAIAIGIAAAAQLAPVLPVPVPPTLAQAIGWYMVLVSQFMMLVALLQKPSAPYTPIDRTTLLLDASTVIVGGLLVVWYDVFTRSSAGNYALTWSFVLAHLVVTGDLVLLLVTSVLWRRTAFQHRARVLLILASSLFVSGAGHMAQVAAMVRGTSVPVWAWMAAPLSLCLMAVSAWLKSATASTLKARSAEDAARAKFSTNVIPYAAVLPGFAMLLIAAFERGVQPVGGLVVGAVVLTGLAFARQVAASREAVRALTESTTRHNETRFQALVQHSSDVITILDADGTIRYASPSMTTVLGHDAQRLLGTKITSMLHPDDQASGAQFLADLAKLAGPRATPSRLPGTLKREWRIAHQNGDWMTVDNVGTNLLREPVVRGLVLNTRDVTEQSVIMQQYTHQAFHDPLTDLANRSLFLYQVGHALARGARHRSAITVMFLDLDNFKTVNDSLGHAAGDRLLVDAARRLASCVRDSDLIARLGGDEFAVLIEESPDDTDVLLIADRIAAAMSRPFAVGGKEVFVSASIGIARSTSRDSTDELVRNADVAMYVAKTRGKGTHVMFEPEMHTAALERLVVEADLRAAIEREEFMLQFQPIVLLTTGEIIGAEALVRWTCRERGTVPPGLFIPIAEETGLIVAIGRWVLRHSCRMARRWESERGQAMRITVNLSGRQLQEPGIIEDVRQALADSGLDPSHLVLEITESMLMHNTEMSMERLTALKALGVSLAIDDFGTGYSSLSYLQRYPIDILKIDKAFVDVIDKAGDGPVLASAIVALGETLRMNTVAEGIETEAQRGQLLALGCELGQGYLFAPPLDAEDFYRLLVARGARSYSPSKRVRSFGAQAA